MYHYPERHRQEIKNNIPKIQENARIREIRELEPTIDEFRSVMEIIKSYLKKKKTDYIRRRCFESDSR